MLNLFFFVRVDLCVKDLVFSEVKKISTFFKFLDGNKSVLKLRGENFESFPMTGQEATTGKIPDIITRLVG